MSTTFATTTPVPAPASVVRPAKPWLLDFVLLAAIWGASFLFIRVGAKEFGVFATAGLRVAIASAFLMPIVLLRGHGPSLRQHWKLSFAVGILNSAIPFACFSFALLSITTGLSSILNATTPLFGAVVAWLWLRDRPTGSRAVGLLIGFAGVALLAWDKASFKPDASGNATGWAVLACLLATLCYGLAASFTKRHLSGLPSLVTATGSQLGASIVLVPLAWRFWPAQTVSLHAWLTVIALGVLCSGVAYILYFRLIERAGPARALSVTFAIPVFALLYGGVLLGEEVTTWMLVCGVVIIVGTSLTTGLVKFSRK